MGNLSRWRNVPMSRTYVGLFDGPHATPKPSDDGPVFLGIGNITEDGHLDLSDVRHIAEEDFPKWTKRVEPTQGDIVFTYEATLNRYAIIPEGFRGCLGRRLALIRPNPDIVDTKFLYYSFFGSAWRATIASNTLSGATVDRIPLSRFPEFPIDLPPLSEQRHIASILSAYDDLIANNTRRIAILEEMARRIYEEWFVRFRFPGHENVRMVESELGPVPDGWARRTVDSTFETMGGGTPSKAEPDFWNDGSINWYSPTDLTGAKTVFMDESAVKINALGLSKSSAKLFPPYSVMMTSRATIGATAVNTTEASTNQGFIACIPSESFPLWLLFHWVKANVGLFESLGTGATFKEITKGVFRKIEVLVPEKEVVSAFERAVFPMMRLVLALERKNRNLRTTRDLLLPRLISGELDVSSPPEPEAAVA